MDPSEANAIAKRLTDGWIQRCGGRSLEPAQTSPDPAAHLLIALFIASLGSSAQRSVAPHKLAGIIQSLDRQMDMYERSDLLDLALDCIPLQDLHTTAERLVESKEVPGFEDGLADALVKWFKTWFKWADPIKCPLCSGKTNFASMGTPDAEESLGGAGRIELHRCAGETQPNCTGLFRFPRYNDPKALMKSCLGRCGEFANLFCLFLRAVGLRARYVWNLEDHVWNEHFSPSMGRWIHLDSCEAVRNEPLLYDRGWGKKMSYVLAFSVDGAQDVSRGYVQDWQEALTRRLQGSEDGLKQILDDVTRRRRVGRSPSDTEQLEQEDRTESEWLADAPRRNKTEPTAIDGEGRQSGTEEWKRQRGEDGTRTGTDTHEDTDAEPQP
ncbi:peptide-N4-(N-acetyl-beta- glucosaminyl)asparagine amidase [Tulasnella sp. JGI-2019a]|nr:peptide-N4-(N-acetyl-beta- glucosaminyl)asparagine amidase [Tulasnella sp. JGI-2019a]